jgi:hypothetical protein
VLAITYYVAIPWAAWSSAALFQVHSVMAEAECKACKVTSNVPCTNSRKGNVHALFFIFEGII